MVTAGSEEEGREGELRRFHRLFTEQTQNVAMKWQQCHFPDCETALTYFLSNAQTGE